jgi:hypothetical protein
MNVRFWNYGIYSSDNYGAHSMAFEDANGNCYWFSYKTLVAFQKRFGQRYVHKNIWGTTTGKHLNWIDGGDKKNRLDSDEFRQKFKEVFGKTEEEIMSA